MTRRLRDKVERIARAVRDREAQADANGDKVAPWAQLFAAAHDRADEPSAGDLEAAADFVADCVARGVEPTWIELMKLAGDD